MINSSRFWTLTPVWSSQRHLLYPAVRFIRIQGTFVPPHSLAFLCIIRLGISQVANTVYYQSRNTQKISVVKLQPCGAEIWRMLIPLTIECIHFKAVCFTWTTETGMTCAELCFNQLCDSKTHICLRTRTITKHFKAPLFFFFSLSEN